MVKCAEKVVAKARTVAAHLLEASEDDLEFANGTFTVKGTDKGKAIQEIAFAAFIAHDYPEDMEPSLDADAVYDPENFSFPHGTHLCATEVDTETGSVEILQSVQAADAGTVMNPQQCLGQVEGGVAQAIGSSLYEEVMLDGQGLVLTPVFRTYRVPQMADIPTTEVYFAETSDALGPFGAKSMSESPYNPVAPALANAIRRAVGVRPHELPMSRDRVWRLLHS